MMNVTCECGCETFLLAVDFSTLVDGRIEGAAECAECGKTQRIGSPA